jgi:hypothetical protein
MEWILSEHAATIVSERNIELDWVELALRSPDAVARDLFDPDLQHSLKAIDQAKNRVLRVVCNARVSPFVVVTVFFDRRERRRRESQLP